MCGIVGIVSRPPDPPTPTADELLGGLDAALAARGDVPAVVGGRRPPSTPPCTACPACSPSSTATTSSPAITARLDQLDAYAAEVDAELADRARSTPTTLERASADSIALRDALWAIRRDRLRTAARGRRPRRARRRRRPRSPATCRSSRRCRRSTAWRSAAATRPASTCSCGTTASTSTTRPSPPRSPSAAGDPLFQSGAGPLRRAVPVDRVQGGGRDRRARRQHPGDARGRRRRRACCAWRCAARGPRSPCSATPAGPASASSPSPTPTR